MQSTDFCHIVGVRIIVSSHVSVQNGQLFNFLFCHLKKKNLPPPRGGEYNGCLCRHGSLWISTYNVVHVGIRMCWPLTKQHHLHKREYGFTSENDVSALNRKTTMVSPFKVTGHVMRVTFMPCGDEVFRY